MKTATTTAPAFEDMPKDYTGLCKLLIPRPIHDASDYENIVEIMNVLAVAGEDALNKDQADYLEMLASLIERYDRETLPPIEKPEPHEMIHAHLEHMGISAAEWGRRIGIDRTLASRLVRGERKLSLEHLTKTTEAFNLPRGFFM